MYFYDFPRMQRSCSRSGLTFNSMHDLLILKIVPNILLSVLNSPLGPDSLVMCYCGGYLCMSCSLSTRCLFVARYFVCVFFVRCLLIVCYVPLFVRCYMFVMLFNMRFLMYSLVVRWLLIVRDSLLSVRYLSVARVLFV